ncbi:Aminomethyltransferase [Aquimixticola soesokkakensis]|uniref:aminomethyltransferase n=1 Tax=Aquimixticola soesokkakensis TaxID=1519096 RepID=A0A1Y5S645_9RHOB|nr:glycine cleavage system aminomethyltransferase GcvT [Aquimixticola soesokkakensis]SLN33320.1 Aminomethyltransferase [Aquimixticola soesokkakensis]
MTGAHPSDLKQTPLAQFHRDLGAKMVPFAGYEMPVQYPMGVLKEHLHTRSAAGLFDVSHMGQVILRSARGVDYVAQSLEALVPVDVLGLKPTRQRYGVFTTVSGGISDDLMIAHAGDCLFLVVNAACKEADIAHLMAELPDDVNVEVLHERALLALQGPLAEQALARLVPEVAAMKFMDSLRFTVGGIDYWVSRSGYTGEDGFEISVPAHHAIAFARSLCEMDEVAPIGLGARDSLRLEAGLCLYGHDLDTTTTPAQGNIAWAIQKVRRTAGARAGGFLGADVILPELERGPERLRVGLLPQGRAPMREGTPLFASADSDTQIGTITSGGFGPTVGAPVAMGYLPEALSADGTQVFAELRGKRLAVVVAPMPFRPSTYKR